MPSDLVSFSISTGLGASVLAGLISGVCYILVNRRSGNKPDRKWHCNVCGKYLRTVERVLHKEDFVVCIKCGGKTCKPKCCIQEPANGWICQTCHAQSNGWFKGMQKIMQPLTRALYTNTIMNEGTINEIDEDLDKLRNKEKEQVRDFIERLINNMLGGNVDDASVDNMYNDSHYLPILGQSPCSSHALLKQLVHCLIREASKLPTLEVQQNSNSLIDETSRTYEDLLATAILNKVISNAQNNLPSSSANSVSSRRSTSSRDQVHNFSFGEETLDSKWKSTDIDNTSVSSLEEWVQTDSSLGSTKYVDKLSLTIHQRIEEVSSSDSDDEEQDLEYMRANSAFSNDEPNWFLQRKPFQGNNSPVPVPMLVPNPTSEAKVLIGDQEIDDTSDLSDAASDFENMDTGIGIENHLIDSKSIIGGKTIFSDLNFRITSVSDDEISADSGVKEGKDFDEIDQDYLIARTECIPTKDMIDASLSSINSNTEKDTEYTESYASLPRTVSKKHTSSKSSNGDVEYPKNFEISNCDRMDNNDEEEENNNDAIFPGNYSKKEKEKWKHTVEMKYNPYSRENIEKRIKKTSNSMDKIFGSDYYVRQASVPSGARGTSQAEVSLNKRINQLEENYTYSSLPRSLYSPRNSSKNFVKNPLLNFPENYSSL